MLDTWAFSIFFFVTSYAAIQFYELADGRLRANTMGFIVLLGVRSGVTGCIILALSMALSAFSEAPHPALLMGGSVALLGMTVVRHIFPKPRKPGS